MVLLLYKFGDTSTPTFKPSFVLLLTYSHYLAQHWSYLLYSHCMLSKFDNNTLAAKFPGQIYTALVWILLP